MNSTRHLFPNTTHRTASLCLLQTSARCRGCLGMNDLSSVVALLSALWFKWKEVGPVPRFDMLFPIFALTTTKSWMTRRRWATGIKAEWGFLLNRKKGLLFLRGEKRGEAAFVGARAVAGPPHECRCSFLAPCVSRLFDAVFLFFSSSLFPLYPPLEGVMFAYRKTVE